MSCPPFDALLAWIEAGRPGGGTLQDHDPARCPRCTDRLALLNEMAGAMGQPAPEAVSPALRRRTLDALAAASAAAPEATPAPARPSPAPARPSLVSSALDRLQEFVAELLDPSALPGLATGLRGEQDGDVQCYRVGPYTLDVGLVDRRALLGQLTDDQDEEATEFAGADCILCGADGSIEGQLTEEGGFRFDDAGPGRYALMIETSAVRLVFPDIDLTEA